MDAKPWTPPVATPIRCYECGAPLTPDELRYYDIHCELCETGFHERMQRDIDAEPDRCRARFDPECKQYPGCPQHRDGEPARTGRLCPLPGYYAAK